MRLQLRAPHHKLIKRTTKQNFRIQFQFAYGIVVGARPVERFPPSSNNLTESIRMTMKSYSSWLTILFSISLGLNSSDVANAAGKQQRLRRIRGVRWGPDYARQVVEIIDIKNEMGIQTKLPVDDQPTSSPTSEPSFGSFDGRLTESSHSRKKKKTKQPSLAPSIKPSGSPTTLYSAQPARENEETLINGFASNGLMEGDFVEIQGPDAMVISGAVAAAGLLLILIIVKFVMKPQISDETDKDASMKGSKHHVRNAHQTAEMMLAAASADQPFDLSGSYQLIQNENFENFLKALGIPWAARATLQPSSSLHHVSHTGNLFAPKFKGIPKTIYIIGGPSVETTIRGYIFEDSVKYTDDGLGVQLSKQSMDENYTIQLCWRPHTEESKVQLALSLDTPDGQEPTQAIQVYEEVTC